MLTRVESEDHLSFMQQARVHLNPFTARSGTFWIARLLQNLILSQRPNVVMEFGAGYTSLFIARAMQDAAANFANEKAHLLVKCVALLEQLRTSEERIEPACPLSLRQTLLIYDFLDKGGEASCLDPTYYRASYDPRFYCLESAADDSAYVQQLRTACAEMGLASNLEISASATINCLADKLDAIARPIDMFWFDCGPYKDLFRISWNRLSEGGTMVFHRGLGSLRADIDWILDSRSSQNDISLYELVEPNKLLQNGAYILQKRRTTRLGHSTPGQPTAMTVLRSVDNFVRAEIAGAQSIFAQSS